MGNSILKNCLSFLWWCMLGAVIPPGRLNQFPWASADAPRAVLFAVGPAQMIVAGGEPWIAQAGGEAAPVEIFRTRQIGEFEHSRHHVHRGHQLIARLAGGKLARPRDDHRDAHPAFTEHVFEPAHHGPLSLVTTTMVFSVKFKLSKCFRISPTL